MHDKASRRSRCRVQHACIGQLLSKASKHDKASRRSRCRVQHVRRDVALAPCAVPEHGTADMCRASAQHRCVSLS
eukprot:357886-Chlamydomonas_euryale.AAC.1